MKIILSILLMLYMLFGTTKADTSQGTTKFSVSLVSSTCDVNFDPVLNLEAVPHAKGIIEHPEFTISVTCTSQSIKPLMGLTQFDPVINYYKVRMQPNQLLLYFKDKSSQKYMQYNAMDNSSTTDPTMTGVLGGTLSNYEVQLIPITEIDDIVSVLAKDGNSYVGIELYYQ
ncbi:hypothetical protein QA364_RS17835 [Escherichia coli]|nr:hypothetical protein [Escherichia coli]EEW0818707.1 hypothetical protein [Escherichia coli]EFI4367781.1 hypothetical protein [Escherichia coli]EFJ1843069.1 hypothetical protein [Escherichia coli]EFJ6728494.1 hypothetical protein [Escherichia coli]